MEETQFLDKRTFERIPVELPLRFLDLTSDRKGLAQTHDISANGIGIHTNEKLLPRTSLEMWLQLPNSDVSINITGWVVWSDSIEPNQYKTGISLEEIKLMAFSSILRNLPPNKTYPQF